MNDRSILIVENDPIRGEALELVLRHIGGYETAFVQTSLEAFRTLVDHKPAMILVNTTLQTANDGIRLVQAVLLKLKTKAPLVMAITAARDRATVQDCVQAGVMGYIVHPYDPPELLGRIGKVFAERENLPGRSSLEHHLKQTLDKIIELPTISPVYKKFEDLANQGDGTNVSANDLELIMRLDPSLTAKVLQMANSAFFGFNRRITSVKDAASLLGFVAIRNAVLTAAAFEALKEFKDLRTFSRVDFWKHCIGCGTIAKEIAAKVGLETDMAFVAGLLHDMGKVVSCLYFTEQFENALNQASRDTGPLVEAEEEIMHINHTEIGKFLAEKWNLPEPLPAVIGGHHFQGPFKEEDQGDIFLIHIADSLCHRYKIGSAGQNYVPPINKYAMEYLGVNEEQLETWFPEIEPEIQKAFGLLELI